jgi:hypothetical protein
VNNIKTDAGWVRDSEGKNTGDWEVVIYVDDEPVGRILAYPSHSYVHDVAPNIRVALLREFDKLIRCECDPEDNWVHWIFTSDGPCGHTSFPCATPEEATKAVTLLNGLISLAKEEPTVTP